MDLLTTIENSLPSLPNRSRKVAAFILEHPEAVENYTVTKIANLSQTSASAVMRFCQSH